MGSTKRKVDSGAAPSPGGEGWGEGALSSIRNILNYSAEHLAQAGIDTPLLDAQLLMTKVLGCAKLDIIAHPERKLSDYEQQTFYRLLEKRASRYPLAYILGNKEFYGLDIEVSPGVLIPRPETELLVEECIKRLKPSQTIKPLIADVGTGSGAISVAIAANIPNAIIYATEISPDALKVARHNIENHQLTERVHLVEGDFLEPLKSLGVEFDAIVSNPPYIPSVDIETLEPEIAVYEPRSALDGGVDGLDAYRSIFPDAIGLLRENGFIAVEVGMGEASAVKGIAISAGYRKTAIFKDLAGVDRVVIAKK
ncbi:peptide chain release factor N(5)-glutamine methyltransferase [bacterium]|nr:peptide chain release factor N(5)-glutamine methyltransferase [bacterium]